MPQYLIDHEGRRHEAEVRRLAEHLYEVVIDGRRFEVDACMAEQSVFSLLVDGANFEVHFAREGDLHTLLIAGARYELTARDRRNRSAFNRGAGLVTGRQVISAPMPGRVLRVLVEAGQAVQAGEALLTLEAMKMENQLRSPVAGQVLELLTSEGEIVATGAKLMVVG